ncbi:MAG TPA: helix-turn-helix transcriptional regulator [Solirubrobacteraceae bacterium]|jgi:AraC-like DNA-binding protein
MDYREHPAPPSLRPWLACTWERTGDDGRARILPDGCIDVVWTEARGTQIVGTNSTAFLVAVPLGVRVVGARLRPGAAPGLLGLEPQLVRDERPPIEQVLGDRGARLAWELERSTDPAAALVAWLQRRAERADRPDRLVAATVTRLGGSASRVDAVAEELGVSERALRRRVTSAVGYGPKRLARVLRLWRALSAARAGEDLARVAYDAGYADQAHFSGDCRQLAGVPPSALLAE